MLSQKPEEKEKWIPGELNNYIGCIQAHGSVQLSYGAVTLTGFFNPDNKYKLRRLPDGNDKSHMAIRKLVTDVLKLFMPNGQPLLIMASKSTQRVVTG